MRSSMVFSFLILFLFTDSATFSQDRSLSANKKAILESVEKHEKALIDISDQIWALAETAFEERKGDIEYKAILPDGPPPIPNND